MEADAEFEAATRSAAGLNVGYERARIGFMPDLLNSISEHLHDSANVKAVYGDPISTHGRTIVPVARVAYGFGGGSGKSLNPDKPGEGNGGGGGVLAIPLGVFEVTEGGTRFIAPNQNRNLIAAGLAGLCVGLFWGRRR